mmetsp:Transcript_5720/g.12635  ORF Transcript_5720/g.12635 Transcript_5720/m.12635 type:complete len:565 (+) Transcript_5720:140-1834(+)
MDKDKPSRRGPSKGCRPGVVIAIVAVTCLCVGFMAGKLHEQGLSGEAGKTAAIVANTATSAATSLVNAGSEALSRTQSQVSNLLGVGNGPICSNTCFKANDGVCDEGRIQFPEPSPSAATVLCDLGTDCADCGPWTPSAPPGWLTQKRMGPIELLRSKNISVYVKPTTQYISKQMNFLFAYTDPTKDYDVSRSMEHGRSVELGITKIFYKIFENRCIKQDGTRSLFVDVGSNFGWFSLVAAAMGCRALAFEPVPHFHAFLEYSVHVNGYAKLVDMRTNVVSHETGKTMKMVVPNKGIWGTAGIEGSNIDSSIKSEYETHHVPSYTLDELVKEDVILMKVDVEGWEWSVMQGARKMFSKYNVENIVMEYSPGVPERSYNHEAIIATVQMLIDMCDRGFRIGHIEDRGAVSEFPQALPAMEEIALANLRYDLRDAHTFKKGQLGCPIPEELKKFWHICNGMPEDLNPRSLRGIIGHNTNIWASKNSALLPLEGTIGVLKLDEPANKFFITNKANVGMGTRPCAYIDPKYQVRHRCRCTKAEVCGEEEALVEKLAAQGKMASNYKIE